MITLYLFSFVVGIIIGSYSYSKGYRAQLPIKSPFYKEN